jgi:hypothetical protein
MARASRFFALFAAIGAITMLAITASGRAGAFSYIENGSFENGTTGWQSGSLDLVAVGADEVPPTAGAMSARLTADGGPFTLSQTLFDVSPGAYTVSANVRRTVPGTQIFLRAQAVNPEGPGADDLYASAGADTWIQLSGEITLTAYSQVEVAIKGTGSGAVYIDDVRFEGAAPISATPTVPAVATDSGSSTPVPTSTRTATPTKTASPTRTPTAPAAPLIASLRNGGFEDIDDSGMPVGWDRYGGDLSLASSPVRSGAYAARLQSATDSTKWLYQTVAVVPSDPYAFDAWIADIDPAVTSAWLRISWYESDDGSGAALATADSTTRLDAPDPAYRFLTTGAVIAPDAARSARLRVLLAPASAAAAAIYVDDASFGPADPLVPSPPTPMAASATTEDISASEATIPRAPKTATGSARGLAGKPPAPAGFSQSTGAHVVINEVLYDPSGPGADAANEWIELYNATDATVDLTGWTIADATSADTVAELQLAPREFAIIAASDSFSKTYPGFTGKLAVNGGRLGNSLGNDGDRLILTDTNGALVDAISWGSDATVLSPAIPDVPAGHSIERRAPGADSDSAEDFVDNESPSPGAPIAAPSTQPHPKAVSDAPAIVSRTSSSFGRWLPWALTSAAVAAIAVMLAWRAVPTLTQRLRTRA